MNKTSLEVFFCPNLFLLDHTWSLGDGCVSSYMNTVQMYRHITVNQNWKFNPKNQGKKKRVIFYGSQRHVYILAVKRQGIIHK